MHPHGRRSLPAAQEKRAARKTAPTLFEQTEKKNGSVNWPYSILFMFLTGLGFLGFEGIGFRV